MSHVIKQFKFFYISIFLLGTTSNLAQASDSESRSKALRQGIENCLKESSLRKTHRNLLKGNHVTEPQTVLQATCDGNSAQFLYQILDISESQPFFSSENIEVKRFIGKWEAVGSECSRKDISPNQDRASYKYRCSMTLDLSPDIVDLF